MDASCWTASRPWRRASTRWAFFAREPELFRKVGHVLLDGERVEAPVRHVLLAHDLFIHSEASADQVLWRALDKIGSHLPEPEHRVVAGEEIDAWRVAFRVIQGFEIQSTLLPFIKAHAGEVDLGAGIKERFAVAAAITPAEAEAARAHRAEIAERLQALVQPGTLIVLPTTPTLPPEHDIPDGASFAEFRTLTLGHTCHAGLPQISIPAGVAAGCPVGLSFIAWPGGDEALLDLAVKLTPLVKT